MNVAFADVHGPFAGGSAYDMINPHQRASSGGGAVAGPEGAAAADAAMGGNPVLALIMFLGAFIVLGWIVSSSSALAGKAGVLLTPVFWVMNGLGIILILAFTKLAVNRFPVPGVTPVVNFVTGS